MTPNALPYDRVTSLTQLRLSRAEIQKALAQAAIPGAAAPHSRTDHPPAGIAMFALLRDGLRIWTQPRPLHAAAARAGLAVNAVMRPVALRAPIALVVTAAVVGGLLARGRLWRWLLRPPLLVRLALPYVLTKTVVETAKTP